MKSGFRRTFLIFAFGIPFICIHITKYLPQYYKEILNLIIFGIEAASPSLASLLTIYLFSKRDGVRKFLRKKYYENFSFKYCVMGFLAPAILYTLGKLITNMTVSDHGNFLMPTSKKMLIIAWALIAEELGWRGFLQERLERLSGVMLTPLFVGIFWALWHYHFWLSGTMDVPISAFLYGCILESYGYYIIIRLSKGNIIPASIWHFGGNLFINVYLMNPDGNHGRIVPYVIVNGLFTVYFFCFVKMAKRHCWKKQQ